MSQRPGGTWSQAEKLTADDAYYDDWFGISVSVSGNLAIVGAYLDGTGGLLSGSAYVFDRDPGGSWSQVQKLTADPAAGGDRFGFSVSVSGERAILGAHYSAATGGRPGAAYVFDLQCSILRGTRPDMLFDHALATGSTWTDTDASDPELYYQVTGAAVLFMTRSPDGPLLSW